MSCLLVNNACLGGCKKYFLQVVGQRTNKWNRKMCPMCKGRQSYLTGHVLGNILFPSYIQHGLRYSSTFTLLNQILSTYQRKRKSSQKYVELIQVGNKEGTKVTENLAKIRKFSPSDVLQKLGVTSHESKITFGMKNKNLSSSMIKIEDSKKFSECQSQTVQEVRETDLAKHLLEKRGNVLEELPWELKNYQDEFLQIYDDPLQQNDFNIDNHENRKDDCAKYNENVEIFHNKAVETSKIKRKKVGKKSEHSLEAITALLQQNFKKKRLMYAKLLSYVDVCVNCHKTDLAQKILLHVHQQSSLESEKHNVTLYNTVLRGLANEGQWKKLLDLLASMERIGPRPTLQSYLSAVECAVRTHKTTCIIEELLQRIKRNGKDINNILKECVFVKNQKEKVLKGIRMVLPNFTPKPITYSADYSCELVQKLNSPPPEDHFYSPLEDGISALELRDLAKQQLAREFKGHVRVKSIANKKSTTKKHLKWRKVFSDFEETWRKAITLAFQENIRNLKLKSEGMKKNQRFHLHPYLIVLPTDVYIDIIMQEIIYLAQMSGGFSPTLSVLQTNLGEKIMERYFLHMKNKNGILDKIQKIYDEFCIYYSTPEMTTKYNPRQYWELLQRVHNNGVDLHFADIQWPKQVLLQIGQCLYDIIMKTVKIDVNALKPGSLNPNLYPAFFTVYRKHDDIKIREEIKLHPFLFKLYRLSKCDELIFESSEMPMMCPSVPWDSVHSGGYLIASAKFIRLPLSAERHKLKMDDKKSQDLRPIFDSLNQLAECPWKLNEPILDLIIEVFNDKGNLELDIPQPVSLCAPLPKLHGINKKQLSKAMHERAVLKQKRQEMYSLWCGMLYKLSIANMFRNNIIWFPHNLDFRGRVYPCPPHFNHLGSDVSRSLLLFARGKELGEKGLKWLKIHLINLTGTMKRASLVERLSHCDNITEDIMDSADKPFQGKKWWMKSDEPWQTLACCMELTKALRSPDPEKYICHFPVHQDGSCNGLQHYAALGRDEEGAEQVNLFPRKIPQDVYSRVAELVEIERAKDAKKGMEVAQRLDGYITRKVVKQPVMTTVYGVTQFGARQQILRQLKDIPDFQQEFFWKAAAYLVVKTFFVLERMFSATKLIQDWFTESAHLVSSVCGQPIEWITPLGLRVTQPYYKIKRIAFVKEQNTSRTNAKSYLPLVRPDTRKQKNAFPPNYIHSLDSTHMMLTSLFCQRSGITFVSVHDCFWTHPSTVDVMNKICREQFVVLHSHPLLNSLSEQLVKRYISKKTIEKSGIAYDDLIKLKQVLSSVPQTGSFDMKKVLQSTYFFS